MQRRNLLVLRRYYLLGLVYAAAPQPGSVIVILKGELVQIYKKKPIYLTGLNYGLCLMLNKFNQTAI